MCKIRRMLLTSKELNSKEREELTCASHVLTSSECFYEMKFLNVKLFQNIQAKPIGNK